MEWNELIANFFSWVLAVLFAYVTNKIWVFDAPAGFCLPVLGQLAGFFGGRVFTLIVEEIILYVFITRMSWNGLFIKVLAQIVVIILNYVISKRFVFKTDCRNDKK